MPKPRREYSGLEFALGVGLAATVAYIATVTRIAKSLNKHDYEDEKGVTVTKMSMEDFKKRYSKNPSYEEGTDKPSSVRVPQAGQYL